MRTAALVPGSLAWKEKTNKPEYEAIFCQNKSILHWVNPHHHQCMTRLPRPCLVLVHVHHIAIVYGIETGASGLVDHWLANLLEAERGVSSYTWKEGWFGGGGGGQLISWFVTAHWLYVKLHLAAVFITVLPLMEMSWIWRMACSATAIVPSMCSHSRSYGLCGISA